MIEFDFNKTKKRDEILVKDCYGFTLGGFNAGEVDAFGLISDNSDSIILFWIEEDFPEVYTNINENDKILDVLSKLRIADSDDVDRIFTDANDYKIIFKENIKRRK